MLCSTVHMVNNDDYRTGSHNLQSWRKYSITKGYMLQAFIRWKVKARRSVQRSNVKLEFIMFGQNLKLQERPNIVSAIWPNYFASFCIIMFIDDALQTSVSSIVSKFLLKANVILRVAHAVLSPWLAYTDLLPAPFGAYILVVFAFHLFALWRRWTS